MSELTYAKVGGPPDDWYGLEIVNVDTGEFVTRVVEVDAAAGWLIRLAADDRGQFVLDGDQVKRERLTGRFRIIRPKAVADE